MGYLNALLPWYLWRGNLWINCCHVILHQHFIHNLHEFEVRLQKKRTRYSHKKSGRTAIKCVALSRAQGTAVRSRQEHIKLLHAIHLVEGLKFCLDQTEIQSTQRSSLNCSCLLRSILLSVKEVLLLVFRWVPLRVLDKTFPGTSNFCSLSERCCLTLKSEAQVKDSSHFTSFLGNLTLLLEHEVMKTP